MLKQRKFILLDLEMNRHILLFGHVLQKRIKLCSSSLFDGTIFAITHSAQSHVITVTAYLVVLFLKLNRVVQSLFPNASGIQIREQNEINTE